MSVVVLPLLHTGLIDGQQLSVSKMVPSFGRGELFAIKSYWFSILQQLSPYSYITVISSQVNPE